MTQAQIQIMAYEAAAAFAPERQRQSAQFSPAFAQLLAFGQSLHGADFAAAQSLTIAARRALDAVFESVDVLLASSAEGEAPAGLGTTGNPIFYRLWTLLGNPCVHVPAGVGEHGLPSSIHQAFATGKSVQQVVYCGVSRSCRISKSRFNPFSPALASTTVPRP